MGLLRADDRFVFASAERPTFRPRLNCIPSVTSVDYEAVLKTLAMPTPSLEPVAKKARLVIQTPEQLRQSEAEIEQRVVAAEPPKKADRALEALRDWHAMWDAAGRGGVNIGLVPEPYRKAYDANKPVSFDQLTASAEGKLLLTFGRYLVKNALP